MCWNNLQLVSQILNSSVVCTSSHRKCRTMKLSNWLLVKRLERRTGVKTNIPQSSKANTEQEILVMSLKLTQLHTRNVSWDYGTVDWWTALSHQRKEDLGLTPVSGWEPFIVKYGWCSPGSWLQSNLAGNHTTKLPQCRDKNMCIPLKLIFFSG